MTAVAPEKRDSSDSVVKELDDLFEDRGSEGFSPNKPFSHKSELGSEHPNFLVYPLIQIRVEQSAGSPFVGDLEESTSEEEITRHSQTGSVSTQIRILGEPFLVERENGKIYLSHSTWSLVGMGDTLLEAELDLYEEARDAAELFFGYDESEVASSTRRMLAFIRRVLPFTSTSVNAISR